ncbi:MAG: hypothetical protein Q7K65_05380 [Candidatus Buchananbacteria bacterium]|nr:hypothetical protein [Candidatus Buchananbacteria bacterium]
MNALIFAQTVFYLAFSLLIIVALILGGLISYYLVNIAKNLNKLSENLNEASEEVRENVKEIMDRLSSLPFFSFLLKRSESQKLNSKKGRSK